MSLVDVMVPAGDLAGGEETAVEHGRRRRAAMAILLLGFSTWCAAAALGVLMPSFYGVDEPAHLGYTATVLSRELPEIDDPLPQGELLLLDRLIARYERYGGAPNGRDVVWVANHPPTFYVLAAPFTTAGARLDDDNGALLGMRLVSAICAGLSTVAVAALASRLVPHRPAVAVGAAALFAFTAQVPRIGGLAYSDALGTLVWVVALTAAVEVLRRPPERLTWSLVVVVALIAALAAGTRASLLLIAGTIVVAWAVAAVLAAREGHSSRRALAGLGASVVAPLLLAGPWYLRNAHLYGSITADRYLFERFDRQPGPSVVARLTHVPFWRRSVVGMWQSMGAGVEVVAAPWAMGLLALIALALGIGAARREQRSTDLRAVAAWCAAVCSSLALVYSVARFIAGGGQLHVRYLLPVVAVIVVAIAAGLAARRGRPMVLAGAVAIMASMHGLMLWRFLDVLPTTRLNIGIPAESWADATSHVLWGLWALGVIGAVALLLTLRGSSATMVTPTVARDERPPPSRVDPVRATQ